MQLLLFPQYIFDVCFKNVPGLGDLRARVISDTKDKEKVIAQAIKSHKIENYSSVSVKILPPYTDPWNR